MARHWKDLLLGLGTGAMASVGLPRFLHSRLYKNHLSILMYHAVLRDPLAVPDWCFLDAGVFEKQIAYVSRHFRVLPLRGAVTSLAEGSLTGPALAITFDDGYQNNADIAFPILASYDCPATIFLTTRYIDSDLLPWFGRLNLALTMTAKRSLEWEGTTFDISTAAHKSRTSVALHRALKKLHPYSIDGVVNDLCRELEVDASRKFESGTPYHMLRTGAIRTMLKSGLISFGAHTHNHSILSRLSQTERQAEISGSLKLVESSTGEPCEFFAYPNGSSEDYNAASMELLRSAGVLAAVSSVSGPNSVHTSSMELRRYGIGSDLNFSAFQAMIHHVTHEMERWTSRPRPAHT